MLAGILFGQSAGPELKAENSRNGVVSRRRGGQEMLNDSASSKAQFGEPALLSLSPKTVSAENRRATSGLHISITALKA